MRRNMEAAKNFFQQAELQGDLDSIYNLGLLDISVSVLLSLYMFMRRIQ